MKQTLKIGAMLLVVAALTMTGVALAQSGDEVTDQTATVGDRPLYSKILEWLDPLVAEGTIDQSQADAVADTLAASLPGGMYRLHQGVETIREAADFLGLTPQQVVEAMRGGTTLADLAVENGSSAEALIDHLVGVVEEHLDQAVADGRITEEQKTEALSNATERLTDLVNGDLAMPLGPGGMGRGHGMGGPCGDDTGWEELGA